MDGLVRGTGVVEWAAACAGGIEDEHGVGVELGGPFGEGGEDCLVLVGADSWFVDGIDHGVAEVAGDAVAVILVEHGSVGVDGVLGDEGHGDVAAHAEGAGVGDVLVGGGHLREEERIASGLGHERSRPGGVDVLPLVVVGVAHGAVVGVKDGPLGDFTDLGAGEAEVVVSEVDKGAVERPAEEDGGECADEQACSPGMVAARM